MKCERCSQKEATVFFEQTLNGHTTSMHLCADCASETKKEGFFGNATFSLGTELFGDLFGFTAPGRAVSTAKSCPDCGATFSAIRREGKVFCPRCYEAFAEELSPTIHSLHGKAVHTGRVPRKSREGREKQSKLTTLREQLKSAVAAEQYEEAARLRDEIRTMEKEEH